MYFSASIFSLLEFYSPTLTSPSIALTNFVCTLLGLMVIDHRRPSPHPASLDPRNDPRPHSLFSRLRMPRSSKLEPPLRQLISVRYGLFKPLGRSDPNRHGRLRLRVRDGPRQRRLAAKRALSLVRPIPGHRARDR